MKSKIEYIIKHNLIFQKFFSAFLSCFLRILSIFIKVDSDLILFVSYMGKSYNDSPKKIYEYLIKNGYDREKCVWAFNSPSKFCVDCKTIKIDTIKYFITALKSKYWVSNVNIERGLHFKKKKTVYINTWHGVPLKKIGNDCSNRKDYDFRKINYLCVSGAFEEKVYSSAFKTSRSNYLKVGMPRNDDLYHLESFNEINIKKNLNIPENKKIILYAPTWRDSNDGGKTYQIKPPINFQSWREKLSQEYIVLFRAHSLTTKILNVEFDDFMLDCSNYASVNELMVIADILITDYSAIAFDYSILEKPVMLFAYDYNEYLSERGFYFDIKNYYGDFIFYEENALLNGVLGLDRDKAISVAKKIKKDFMEYGGNSTEKCGEIILKDKLL